MIHKRIDALLIFFLLFPYVGFVPGIDTQPNFILISLISLLVIHIRFSLNFAAFYFFSVFFLFISFFINYNDISAKFVASYVLIYLNIFLIYSLISSGYLNVKLKHVVLAMSVYLFVGLVQLIIPDFFSFLVTRSVEAAMSFASSGRGVRSLTGEPATLGKILNIFLILTVFMIWTSPSIKNKKSVSNYVFIVSFISAFFIHRSAYAIIVLVFMYLLYLLIVNRLAFLLLAVGVLLSIGSLIIVMESYEHIRFVRMIGLLFEEPELLLQQGAIRRVFNVYISLNNLLYYGFSGSADSEAIYSSKIYALFGELKYLVYNRNLGGFVELILRLGIFSLPIIMVYFIAIIRISRLKCYHRNVKYRMGIWFGGCLLLLTFQDGSPVLPLSWFVVFYFYSYSSDFFGKLKKSGSVYVN